MDLLDGLFFIALMNQANARVGRLNGIYKAQHETRVSKLEGIAASAGIDRTPPS